MQSDDPTFGALRWDDEDRVWLGSIDFGGHRVELSIDPGLTDPTPDQRQAAIEGARVQIGPLLSSEPRLREAALAVLVEEDEEGWLRDGRLASSLRLVEIALHESGELYYDCSNLLGAGTLLTVFFGPDLQFGDAEIDIPEAGRPARGGSAAEIKGAFRARQFRILSFAPDPLFQFFVAPDALYVVKVGPARAGGPHGLMRDGVLLARQVQAVMRLDPANYEVRLAELTRASLGARARLGGHGSLTLHFGTRRRCSYRFLDRSEFEHARDLLRAAFGDRLTED